MFTETLKERQALSFKTTTTINTGGTTSASTPGLLTKVLRRFRGYFILGTLTSTAAVTISLQYSADDVTYTNITNTSTDPVVSGITTDDSLNCLEITADLLPTGTKYIRATATATEAQNAVVTILLIGEEASYKPGNAYNASTPTNDVVATV